MKRLLDSLAYYILLGHTNGIETEYKRVMNAKREIPVSSCPSNIENMLYANGGSPEIIDSDEQERFNLMVEKLDHKASRYDDQRKPRKKVESKYRKRMRLGIHDGEWLRVDTDGRFEFEGSLFIIDNQAVQYASVSTEYGDYYAMDKILASGGKFYDMNYDEVVVHKIG